MKTIKEVEVWECDNPDCNYVPSDFNTAPTQSLGEPNGWFTIKQPRSTGPDRISRLIFCRSRCVVEFLDLDLQVVQGGGHLWTLEDLVETGAPFRQWSRSQPEPDEKEPRIHHPVVRPEKGPAL